MGSLHTLQEDALLSPQSCLPYYSSQCGVALNVNSDVDANQSSIKRQVEPCSTSQNVVPHHLVVDADNHDKAIGALFLNKKSTALDHSSSCVVAAPRTIGPRTSGSVSQTCLLRSCHRMKLALQVNTRHVAVHHLPSISHKRHLALASTCQSHTASPTQPSIHTSLSPQLLFQPLSLKASYPTLQQVVKLGNKTSEAQDQVTPFLDTYSFGEIQSKTSLGKRKAESLENDRSKDSDGHCGSVKPSDKVTVTKVQVENTQPADISTFSNTTPPKQLSDSTATLQPLAKNLILLPEFPSPTNCITPPSPSPPAIPITLPYSSPSLCPTIIVPCGLPSSTTSAPVTSVNSSTSASSIPVKSNLLRPFKRKKPDSIFIPKASKKIGQPHTASAKPLANITHACFEANAVASSSQIVLDTTRININESDGDDRRGNTNRTGFEKKVQEWADAVEKIRHVMLGLELFNDEPTHMPNGPKLLDVLKEIDRQKNWITCDEERVTKLASRIAGVLRTCIGMKHTESAKLSVQILDNFHQRFMGERFLWPTT